MRIPLALAAAALATCLTTPLPAKAQPTEPLTIVVPFAPGGSNDFIGRALAKQLGTAGHTVVVENKAGASSIIAADYVARARPNGSTLLLATQTTLAVNQYLYKTLPYDPAKSFVPVALLSQLPAVLVVPASSPATSALDLIERIRRSPRPYAYASPGKGTLPYLCAELLRSTEKLQLVDVPYKGSAPALIDLIAGRTQFMFVDLGSAAPLIKSGALRPLLVTGSRRLKAIPQVPTSIEAGLPSLSLSAWTVLVAPAGTPAEVVETLNRDVNAAIQKMADDDRFANLGVNLRGDMTSAQVADFVKTERPLWEQVIRQSSAAAE